jgi:hypothetical protein
MANLIKQAPAPATTKKETPQEEFARFRREELAANGDISPLQKMTEDRDGTTASKKRIKEIWSKPASELLAMPRSPLMIDIGANLPHVMGGQSLVMDEATAQAAVEAGNKFFGQHQLDDESHDKVVAYISVHSDADSRIDVTNPQTWERAYERLTELGVINHEVEPPAPTQVEQTIAGLKADEFRTEVEQRWFAIWEDTWNPWLDSMAQTWSFYPSKLQSRAAIDLLLKLESYGDGRFDECRRRLTASGVFKPGMLTPLEKLESRVDAGEFGDLSTQMGKQRYAAAFNRVKFGSE